MDEARFYRGWRVVFGAGLGVGFGSAVFISVALPLLAAAAAKANGWSQTDVAKGASLALLMQAIGYPSAGFLIDRWGSRRVAAASIVLFAASLVALGLAGDVYGYYLGACAAIGLLAAATNMVGYARAIAHWFAARRGLALGVAAGFQAVGAFTLPILTQKIIAALGWGKAPLAIAAIEAIICLPAVLWLVEDEPRGVKGEAALPSPAVGPLARPAVTFSKLAVSFAVMGFTFYAVASNIAFVLSKAGLSGPEIGRLQAVSGLAVLVGRVGFGRLLDLWPAVGVGLLAIAAAAAFCFGLAHAESHRIALLAAALGGLSIGAESDFLPYLASRYWGRERVSRVMGLFLVAFVLGAALGPVAFAKVSEAFGGALPALYALVLLQLAPAALFLTLPPYPRQAEI